MTDKRKDDLPLVQKINDLLRVCETDNDLARSIMDVLKERGLNLSPPVPVDTRLFDRAIRCLRTAVWRTEDTQQGYQMHPENLCAAKEVIAEYEDSLDSVLEEGE